MWNQPLPNNKLPYIQAHRGYSEIYPENTLLAIDKAYEVGADQVEIDIALSKDGHLVVIHDFEVSRTTNGQGNVNTFTLAELKQLDAGSWKSKDFVAERIPTLDQVAELAKGKGWLNIEIKSRGRPNLPHDIIASKLSETLRHYMMQDNVIIASFDVRPLLAVQECDPELKLMLIDWDPPDSGGLEMAIEHKFYGWTPKPDLADIDRIEKATSANLVVQIDVRDSGRVSSWFKAGAKGFSSDDPKYLKQYLESINL